jgi:hypothetical protein
MTTKDERTTQYSMVCLVCQSPDHRTRNHFPASSDERTTERTCNRCSCPESRHDKETRECADPCWCLSLYLPPAPSVDPVTVEREEAPIVAAMYDELRYYCPDGPWPAWAWSRAFEKVAGVNLQEYAAARKERT